MNVNHPRFYLRGMYNSVIKGNMWNTTVVCAWPCIHKWYSYKVQESLTWNTHYNALFFCGILNVHWYIQTSIRLMLGPYIWLYTCFKCRPIIHKSRQECHSTSYCNIPRCIVNKHVQMDMDTHAHTQRGCLVGSRFDPEGSLWLMELFTVGTWQI